MIFKSEKELRSHYNHLLDIEYFMEGIYKEYNFIDKIYKYFDTYNNKRYISYENNVIPYIRILEEPTYIDIIVSESFDNLKYKQYYYSFDPKQDEYISFRDKKIKIQPNVIDIDKKIFYVESYLEHINSSKISIFINNKSNKNRIGEILIDYDSKNTTIFDFLDNKVYRYTKNTSFESSFYTIKDPVRHNNIIDTKYKVNKYNIVEGDYYNIGRKYNFIESIYRYNIPISLYENKYEEMQMYVIVDYDIYDELKCIRKSLYVK